MTSKEWVEEQWKQGRNDYELLASLKKNNWSEKQSRTLIEATYRQKIFSPSFAAFFSLGAALLLIYTLLTEGFVLTFIITLFVFITYILGTYWTSKTSRKVFFVIATFIIGIGWFFCLLFVLIVISTAVRSLPIWHTLLIIGISFGGAVYAMDCAFHGIRVRLERVEPKNTQKVALWSAVFGLCCILILTFVYVFLFGKVLLELTETVDKHRVEIRDLFDEKIFTDITNLELQQRVIAGTAGIFEPFKPPTIAMSDILFKETAIPTLCTLATQELAREVRFGLAVSAAKEYAQYSASNVITPENLRETFSLWSEIESKNLRRYPPAQQTTMTELILRRSHIKPYEQVQQCREDLHQALWEEHRMNFMFDSLNFDDVNHQDIAAFFIWKSQKKEVSNLAIDYPVE